MSEITSSKAEHTARRFWTILLQYLWISGNQEGSKIKIETHKNMKAILKLKSLC